MDEPFDIKPGLVLEWRHTPDWSVCSRMIVDSVEDGYVWIHFDDLSQTKNRLSIEAVRLNGRPAPKPDLDDRFLDWVADKFGREARRRFGREFVLEQRFSTWDLFLFGSILLASIGPRAWALIPIVLVWAVVRVWAERRS